MNKFFLTFLLVALTGFSLFFGHVAFSGHQADASEVNCLSHCIQASFTDGVILAIGQQQIFLIYFFFSVVAAIAFTKIIFLLLRSDEAIGKFFLRQQLVGVFIRD